MAHMYEKKTRKCGELELFFFCPSAGTPENKNKKTKTLIAWPNFLLLGPLAKRAAVTNQQVPQVCGKTGREGHIRLFLVQWVPQLNFQKPKSPSYTNSKIFVPKSGFSVVTELREGEVR